MNDNTPKLTGSLQENLLVLLAHNDQHGKVLANIVDTNLFQGDYQYIAERCVEYWRLYSQAPKFHTADLLTDVIEDPEQKGRTATLRRILLNMLQLSEGINADYILSEYKNFARAQKLMDATMRAADKLEALKEKGIAEVEEIWNEMLHTREVGYESGLSLHNVDHLLSWLDTHYTEFSTGIPELDKYNVCPARGAAFLVLAAAKAGKSWNLVHLGKHAILDRKKVLHITLEMPAEETLYRYYRSLFFAPKRNIEVIKQTLEINEFGKLTGFDKENVKYDFSFASSSIRDELNVRLESYLGKRANNLKIVRFPPRSLTPSMLRAYLDQAEIVDRFIPDMVILDYIGIVKTDAKNHRISLGRAFEEFRAISIERNYAFVTVHQLSKTGANARTADSTHIAEDWSMVATADIVLTYSCTKAEARYGFGRLFVTNSRSDRDKFGVLITQNFDLGQFVLESHMLDSKYYNYLEELGGAEDDEEESNGDED